MKGVAVLVLLGVAMVAASELLAGDTPVRQSQRERVNERAVRKAEEAAAASSFIESSAAAGSPAGPRLDRLTGAAKTFHPNDQMCVICQFLVQRVQLDMAHFNAVGGFVGAKTAGTGGAANAATGGANAGEKAGADDAFIELGVAVSDSDSDAEEDGEDEEAWEAEDAEEAEMLELAAKEELAESEGDWDTVAALEAKAKAVSADESEDAEAEAETAPAFSETSASVVTQGLTAIEQKEMAEVMTEVRNDAVASAVQQDLAKGMEETPVLVETVSKAGETDGEADEDEMVEEEVTADMLSNADRKEFINQLGESFDSEIDLSSDEQEDMSSMLSGEDAEEEGDFRSPMYNADGSSEPLTGADQVVEAETGEDAVFLQVDDADTDEEEEEAEDESESEDIEFIEVASAPAAPRAYARVLHRAEAEPVAPVLAEVSGEHAHFQSAGGLAAVDRRRRTRRVGIANSPRRFRLADALNGRPRWNRFDPTVAPHPNAQRQQAREMWHRLMQMTYDRLEGYCSTRLPEQFTPFCRPMLRRFRVIAEGIRYGDRPNQICMRTKFCPRGSYVRRSPHNVFKHVAVQVRR